MWGVTSTCWLTGRVTLSRFHLHQNWWTGDWTGQSDLRVSQCFYFANCDTRIDQHLTPPLSWDEMRMHCMPNLRPGFFCAEGRGSTKNRFFVFLDKMSNFYPLPSLCPLSQFFNSLREGPDVRVPAMTEMTTRMVIRAWLISDMLLLQLDRLKCWYSGLHIAHQNWLESRQPAVISLFIY